MTWVQEFQTNPVLTNLKNNALNMINILQFLNDYSETLAVLKCNILSPKKVETNDMYMRFFWTLHSLRYKLLKSTSMNVASSLLFLYSFHALLDICLVEYLRFCVKRRCAKRLNFIRILNWKEQTLTLLSKSKEQITIWQLLNGWSFLQWCSLL